ncbi:MAG: SDR family oxidoreductase [Chloroflexi bacterium]|nr:SDR family oxidoreductase [Chloroflexota bacterium]
MDFSLTDRVAIVTGGAQGLGKASALALAQAGADVVIVARESEEVTVGRSRPHAPVDEAVDEIKALGRRAIGVTADIREIEQVEGVVQQAMAEFGRIDILVNVVGGSWGETFKAGPIMELNAHDLIEAYRVNVVTMFQCSQTVLPIMKKQGKGSIINIASVAGQAPSVESPAYGAAKAGVINMTKTMAAAWGPEVRVNVIAVGGIETPHRPRWSESSTAAYMPGSSSALGRLGLPEEHAGTVVWLASDYAGYITGAVIDANGGARR